MSKMTNGWDRRLFTALSVILAISDAITDSRRSNGPIIIPSRNEIILQKGQNFTLTCKGKTELQFKQQEIPEELTGYFNKIQRQSNISEGEYKYKVVLELYNVDEFAIGYYACFDDSVDGSDALDNLTEEPSGTAHVSYIYIYVNGTGGLFAPMRELLSPREGSKVVIECRPTTPDIKVTLLQDYADTNVEHYSPKLGFVFDSDAISECVVKCVFQKRDGSTPHEIHVIITKPMRAPPQPEIVGGSKVFLKGETFTINCTVKYDNEYIATLSWRYRNSSNIKEESNELRPVTDTLYRSLTIENATEENAGVYVCMAVNQVGSEERKFEKAFLDKPYITLMRRSPGKITTNHNITIKLATEIDSYPPVVTYNFLRDNKPLNIDNKKYITNRTRTGDVILYITDSQVSDSANYTLVAKNKYNVQNITYVVRIRERPVVVFGTSSDWQYRILENSTKTLSCQVIGFPLPEVNWIFTPDADMEEETMNSSYLSDESVYKRTAFLDLPAKVSGNITCEATNDLDTVNSTRSFIVYEMANGFGIKNRENNWFSEYQDVILPCVASKYDFADVKWFANDKELGAVVQSRNPLSLVATLKINHVSLSDAGDYKCIATRNNGTQETETISISVTALRPPMIIEPDVDKTEEVHIFQSINLPCRADGVPPPRLEWYKDGKLLTNVTKAKIYMNSISRTAINSTVVVPDLKDDDMATYECVANSDGVEARRTYKLVRKAEPTNMTLVSVIVSIFFVMILLVAYLTWKIKKEKQFKRELRAAGLLYFKKGVTKSLNPDLGIDEQAELLPYNEKFEFPSEKLKLGKQLGAGAFGVVYKAEARGIINAEETTEVAVKMVKKTADNMYIKALASELKIMVHLGKHINIVNLLGACTKNVGKRELIVIVEYCKFGNIHNYMQRHREVFIDQLTDDKEKNLGRVNRGFYCSTGSTGAQSDYFSTNNTQDTDHTFVNTANTSRSGRKDNPAKAMEIVGVSEGYVQPEWRTNYESDYSFDGRNPRPLTSRDLLVWAFQIARGMEYLANRKVLHGDLAARNVLLADDNVVKICDFGLARNIYNNDEYQKKENSLLPVKWLAIECMTDRIFSTQSDVWSFGIVLWELFSLAKTPYPNMAPSSLPQWLLEGNRLAKPSYADDKLYDVMLKCWEQKPTARPSFSHLQERLGAFLEDNVRNHYVDLNAVYTDMNVKADGQEDYLNMVCAPDYNNLVTPSPHHYVNESNFFPQTPNKLDEEGYLQMSPASKQAIFSPRLQDTKFDFETHKFNPRVSEASSCGSELTPMLTLNNLPRSGSDSDHEGNVSPHLNKICTSIKEEADEVFETKQNNAKNAFNTAVTNPTYIPFSIEVEKKPKDIINTYVNVANGLVK